MPDHFAASASTPPPPPSPQNPYAPPTADLIENQLAKVTSDGRHLFVPRLWVAPAICLVTGADSDLIKPRTIKCSWIHPGFLVLVLASPVIYLLVAMLFQKTGRIAYTMCREAAAARRRQKTLKWLFALSTLVAALAGLYYEFMTAALLFGGLFLVSLFFAVLWKKHLPIVRITDTSMQLRLPEIVRLKVLAKEEEKLAKQFPLQKRSN